MFTPKLDGCKGDLWFFLEQKITVFTFHFRRRTDSSVEKSKMSELSRTEIFGLSVEAALDLRFNGIDARIKKQGFEKRFKS